MAADSSASVVLLVEGTHATIPEREVLTKSGIRVGGNGVNGVIDWCVIALDVDVVLALSSAVLVVVVDWGIVLLLVLVVC